MGKPTLAITATTPLLKSLVTLVGRRADDPELLDFITNTLGQKKVPNAVTDASSTKYVIAKKHGIEMGFDHDIKNDRYPLVYKTKKTFVPYLQLAWIKPQFPEPLPFGLTHSLTADEITQRLGESPGTRGVGNYPFWQRVLDPARDIVLGVALKEITISVAEAHELASRHHPTHQQVGLFVAWAVKRNLIDETRFPAHADLIAAVRKREKKGSELLAGAMPRGVWDVHLKDLPDLRDFAYGWFHNIGGSYIVFDFIKVFKARQGPHGHDEPVLDDDDWKAVDKATKALDSRFKAWVEKDSA